jgi:uncharacterized C2H2 Zn-finger protein
MPTNHIRGAGCPKCVGLYKTTKEFINEANIIHNYKYDYSKTNYINSSILIDIICSIHGIFKQTPSHHLNGTGCPKCYGNKKTTTDEYVQKANKIHNYKYDYSNLVYNGNKNKIIIICPEHGKFKQEASSHLSGAGCPKCSGRNKTTEEYIKKANEVHSYEYDYSETNYVNAVTKIIIICPKHGKFQQLPNGHLKGAGCPKCSGRGFEYVSFLEFKTIIQKFNIKTQREYHQWWKNNEEYCRERGIPQYPDKYYKINK